MREERRRRGGLAFGGVVALRHEVFLTLHKPCTSHAYARTQDRAGGRLAKPCSHVLPPQMANLSERHCVILKDSATSNQLCLVTMEDAMWTAGTAATAIRWSDSCIEWVLGRPLLCYVSVLFLWRSP